MYGVYIIQKQYGVYIIQKQYGVSTKCGLEGIRKIMYIYMSHVMVTNLVTNCTIIQFIDEFTDSRAWHRCANANEICMKLWRILPSEHVFTTHA